MVCGHCHKALGGGLVAGATGSQPGSFAVANGELFFTITTNGFNSFIWTTDGTAQNTLQIAQPAWTIGPFQSTASGNNVYFLAASSGSDLLEGAILIALAMIAARQRGGVLAVRP